jgi:Cysteine rich repeat
MQPNFGQECLAQVGIREAAMQSDWHEDFGVASSCSEDIDILCKDAQVRIVTMLLPRGGIKLFTDSEII